MTPIRMCLNGEGLHFLQIPSELNTGVFEIEGRKCQQDEELCLLIKRGL